MPTRRTSAIGWRHLLPGLPAQVQPPAEVVAPGIPHRAYDAHGVVGQFDVVLLHQLRDGKRLPADALGYIQTVHHASSLRFTRETRPPKHKTPHERWVHAGLALAERVGFELCCFQNVFTGK